MTRLGAQQAKTHYLITNDDQLYIYKYVTLGLNELTRNIIYITYIYMYIWIYIYIHMLKIRYLSLQVIDNKHYHKTGTLHIACNFWKSIWVKITMFYHIYIYHYYKMLAIFMICWLSPLCSDVTNESFYGMGPRISQFTRVEIRHTCHVWMNRAIHSWALRRKGVHQRWCFAVTRVCYILKETYTFQRSGPGQRSNWPTDMSLLISYQVSQCTAGVQTAASARQHVAHMVSKVSYWKPLTLIHVKHYRL